MSQKRETDDALLTGETVPTALERTLAPGVALLVAVSVVLVCVYLLVLLV